MRVAAIDCGTNSLRLLVADASADGRLVDLERRMEIVRLGQGVDRTGRFAPEALERTLRVLREYADTARRLGAERVRMVATSATRDAGNRDEFVGEVRSILGVPPEVVTGQEEAALSYEGAVRELRGRAEFPAPFLMVDIGGGSTEFVLGDLPDDPGMSRSISVDVGCVRLAERHLHSDPPRPDELDGAARDIVAALDRVRGELDPAAAKTLVCVAGTATTVAALALGLERYDAERIHRSRVSVEQTEQVFERLAGMTAEQRAALGPMHPGRVDVIVSGALVLREVVRASGVDEFVASEHDILDGIAYSLASA